MTWMRPARVAACLLGILAPAAPAREDGGASRSHADDEYLVRASHMVEAGLRYLASRQNPDHSFSAEPDEEVTRAPLAVTALATLAFMAGGSTMGRGPYREQVRTGIEYLLDHQVEKPPADWRPGDGMPLYFSVDADSTSRMHGHGYATLALAMAYGTAALDRSYREAAGDKARDDLARMHAALQGAVWLIEESQRKGQTGGWYYDPYDTEHEGSVTITMIQALRAARDVGIHVNKKVIDDAVAYIHKSQAPDGGFKYHLNHPRVTYALTAAAIATLNATGDYDSQVIDRGMEFMRIRDPVLNPEDRWAEDTNFPYYARLYATQAYYVYRDPKVFERWRMHLLEDMEARQNKVTGSFRNEEYGKVYATAVACLLLQIPYQYLPIFQK